MGQYGNQPDFGTRAATINPLGEPSSYLSSPDLNSTALYIGTGGTLICKVVGGSYDAIGQEIGYTIFNNIPNGTFFPVIVSHVYATDGGDLFTTCNDIIGLK